MGVRKFASKAHIPETSAIMQPEVEEWMNGTIQIVAPKIAGGTFNRMTNTKDRAGANAPEVLWEGKARIQAMRWPNVATARQEALASRTVVFHLPMDFTPDYDILEGYRIKVLDGGMSPQFTGGLFVVTSSVNSSYAWDRRIETMMDQGAVID